MPAPIVLFVYNRPWHTKQTVEPLLKNTLADQSELFIFSDAPANAVAQEGVEQVRKYIKGIKGFKSVNIVERSENYGLAKSIITGVTEIISRAGKVIVLEDDLVTSPYFLQYMNDTLSHYEYCERVFHVAGYMYPVQNQELPEAFFLPITSCWGWGTWARAWRYFNNDGLMLSGSMTREKIRQLNFNNTYDYWAQFLLNMEGKLTTWAIFWYINIFLQNGLCLHPAASLVRNIGHDGSGAHHEEGSEYNVVLGKRPVFLFPDEFKINAQAVTALERFFLNADTSRRGKVRKFLRMVTEYFKKI